MTANGSTPARDRPCPEPRGVGSHAPEKNSGKSAKGATGLVVDINHATREELIRLPGVGPKRAAAIVALRRRLKGFRRASDLLRIKGIGVRTLERLAPQLRVGTRLPPNADLP